MDISKLTERDWQQFEERYHDAAMFLLSRSLRNEYLILRDNQYILNDWEKERFNELDKIYG